jgi:hypothetical protein
MNKTEVPDDEIKRLELEYDKACTDFDMEKHGVLYLDPSDQDRTSLNPFSPWPDKSSHPLHFMECRDWILNRLDDQDGRRKVSNCFKVDFAPPPRRSELPDLIPLVCFVFEEDKETALAVEMVNIPMLLQKDINELFAYLDKVPPFVLPGKAQNGAGISANLSGTAITGAEQICLELYGTKSKRKLKWLYKRLAVIWKDDGDGGLRKRASTMGLVRQGRDWQLMPYYDKQKLLDLLGEIKLSR